MGCVLWEKERKKNRERKRAMLFLRDISLSTTEGKEAKRKSFRLCDVGAAVDLLHSCLFSFFFFESKMAEGQSFLFLFFYNFV